MGTLEDATMHGMCHSRYQHQDRFRGWEYEPSDTMPVEVKQRDRGERVGDADRERAAAVLSQAFRDGILRVEEFDQRLSAAYAATTVGELDDVMRDLPRDWSDDLRAAESRTKRAQMYTTAWRAGFATYCKVMLLLVGIWFFTSVDEFGSGEAFFWPIFPILGWGLPLFFSRPRTRYARGPGQRPLVPTR